MSMFFQTEQKTRKSRSQQVFVSDLVLPQTIAVLKKAK